MALETGTYISDLVSTNPVSSDNISQGDDHIRLLKSTIKATFPNITGAVTPTHTDLNKLTASGSPQFSTIELGHASDTTITRSAAGVIAVEGGVIPKENRANTFTANQVISVTDNTNAALRITQLGTGNALLVEDSTNPDSSPFVVDASGNVGIGTSSPSYKLDTNGQIRGYQDASAGASVFIASNTSTANNTTKAAGISYQGRDTVGTVKEVANIFAYPLNSDWTASALGFWTRNSDVTAERMRIDTSGNVGIGTASPSSYASANDKVLAIQNVDQVLTFGAYYQSGVGQVGFINSSNSNNSGSAQPLSFRTGNVEKMRIDVSGNVLVTSSGGLGYGTGSGGTVTQATSKATIVTLNKTNGQIVTHNAALAAGGIVSFQVTNSTVAATDTVILHRASGGSAQAYTFIVESVAAGGFIVTIRNTSAGSLSEAITLNFAVIKATTS